MPLTGKACVDLIITEIAVMQPTRHGLLLLEIAEGVELEEVRQRTGTALLAAARGPRQVLVCHRPIGAGGGVRRGLGNKRGDPIMGPPRNFASARRVQPR